ncbi:hypothetical protein HFO49_19700 [Rhizobium leguminosarum]|uniref:hypothetical protein n=1 Tax=Rhizobium leguminosarum TaxID=384 RepID=UPI001C95F8C0|nr:hypothetical protein [Rhizobium leguminosarum]MBY5589683.1 hypothetical protein [Rhizobium leguminosarum]MBY5604884.1 hypothetical protein [Rhizobium leguminosarum]
MESRALAEYARCIRPERLNLALPRNIPDAARCPAASTQERIQEKGPTEARPSLNRSGENEERRAVHIVRSMSQRGLMSLLRYARQKNFRDLPKRSAPKLSAHVARHLSHCNNDWRLQCLQK